MELTESINKGSQINSIEYWNKQKLVMCAFMDIPKLDNLEQVHKVWNDNWQNTSTQIDYSKNQVTHYANSTVRKPVVIQLKAIPEVPYPVYLDKLTETKDGLAFASALLLGSKTASKQKVISEYKRISGKDANQIRFWIPDASSRKAYPLRSFRCWFNRVYSELGLSCGDLPDYSNWSERSFGVRSIVQKPKASAKEV